MTKRTVTHIKKGYWTEDGAGVKLNRVLGIQEAEIFDPILMLDSFDSTNPDDYTAGFPMHPHRGIETISYVAAGAMRHSDSMGFNDTVKDGGVQWMCAGSGVLHEEQIPAAERLLGVQLWLNLPKADKMCEPSYTAISAESIQSFSVGEASTLRLLSGTFTDSNGKSYAGHSPKHLPFNYYELILAEHDHVELRVDENASAMAFTLLGSALIGGTPISEKSAVKLSSGDTIELDTEVGETATVLVMISSALHEPISWAGPVVMNTEDELRLAFSELQQGTFIKSGLSVNREL